MLAGMTEEEDTYIRTYTQTQTQTHKCREREAMLAGRTEEEDTYMTEEHRQDFLIGSCSTVANSIICHISYCNSKESCKRTLRTFHEL